VSDPVTRTATLSAANCHPHPVPAAVGCGPVVPRSPSPPTASWPLLLAAAVLRYTARLHCLSAPVPPPPLSLAAACKCRCSAAAVDNLPPHRRTAAHPSGLSPCAPTPTPTPTTSDPDAPSLIRPAVAHSVPVPCRCRKGSHRSIRRPSIPTPTDTSRVAVACSVKLRRWLVADKIFFFVSHRYVRMMLEEVFDTNKKKINCRTHQKTVRRI
jgi:hypothetical protein